MPFQAHLPLATNVSRKRQNNPTNTIGTLLHGAAAQFRCRLAGASLLIYHRERIAQGGRRRGSVFCQVRSVATITAGKDRQH